MNFDLSTYLDKLNHAIEQNRLEAANELVSSIQRSFGNLAKLELARAQIFWRQKNFKEAAAAARRCVELDPSISGGYYYGSLASVYSNDSAGICFFGFGCITNCNPRNQPPADVLMALIDCLIRLDLTELVGPLLDQAERRFFKDQRFWRVAFLFATKRKSRDLFIRYSSDLIEKKLDVAISDINFTAEDIQFLDQLQEDSPFASLFLALVAKNKRQHSRACELSLSAFLSCDKYGLKKIASQAAEIYCTSASVSNGDFTNTLRVLDAFLSAHAERYAEYGWSALFGGINDVHHDRIREGIAKISQSTGLIVPVIPYVAGANSMILPDFGDAPSVESYDIGNTLNFASAYHDQESISDLRTVFLCSCDARYLEIYGELLVHSISRTNNFALLHIHVTNPTPRSLYILNRYREKYGNIIINYSTRDITERGENLKSRFALERFFIADRILDLYQKHVLVVDVDIEVMTPIRDTEGDSFDFDVGTLWANNINPWMRYPAIVVFLRDNAKTRMFLSYVRFYVESVFKQRSKLNLWFIDQNAIFVAKYIMEQEEQGFSFGNLSQKIWFGCYSGTETRDAFTARRYKELGIIPVATEALQLVTA